MIDAVKTLRNVDLEHVRSKFDVTAAMASQQDRLDETHRSGPTVSLPTRVPKPGVLRSVAPFHAGSDPGRPLFRSAMFGYPNVCWGGFVVKREVVG